VKLSLTTFGDEQFARDLLRFGERAGDLRPAFEAISDDFYEIEKQQFASEGGFASAGWPALSENYARWKAKHFPGKPILQRSGALMESLTNPFASGAVHEIDRDTLRLGTDVRSDDGFPYPAAHQRPLQGQERRRPIELREVDRRRWVKIIQQHIVSRETGSDASALSGIMAAL
jgi:hypothetical protein